MTDPATQTRPILQFGGDYQGLPHYRRPFVYENVELPLTYGGMAPVERLCMVTHNPAQAKAATRTVHLFDGQLVLEERAA